METTSSPTSSEPSKRSRDGAALAAWLALAALQVGLAILGAIVASSESSISEPLYEYETAFGGAVVYLILIGLTLLIARLYADPGEALGLRSFALRWVWIALGVVLLAGVVTAVIAYTFGVDPGEEQGLLPDTWQPEKAGAIAANAAVIAGIGPLAEELFFRGLGVRALAVIGSVGAVVGSGLVFGLAHGLLTGFVPLALFGIGLAWVRLRSTSVWPGVVAHCAYNGAALLLAFWCAANPGRC
jgi:membrane protease YdiL (CAAX protease family)